MLPIITAYILALPHLFVSLHARATIASLHCAGACEERFVVLNLLGAKRDSLNVHLMLHGFQRVHVELAFDSWMLINAVLQCSERILS